MITPLKEARINAGFTQLKLAELTGITERNIQRIEKGEQDPKTSLSLKIAKELNSTVENLFGLENPEMQEKPDGNPAR